VIELHDVYFDFDKSTLRPEGKAALDKALTVIKANHGEDRVTVVGWTDSMGRCLQPEALPAPRRSRQGLSGGEGHCIGQTGLRG
ncbi:MAG: OmpA family protein, partial [Sutterella wadsworthensis]|nr:OmpA family protein [Sutterella wadsworthensis]